MFPLLTIVVSGIGLGGFLVGRMSWRPPWRTGSWAAVLAGLSVPPLAFLGGSLTAFPFVAFLVLGLGFLAPFTFLGLAMGSILRQAAVLAVPLILPGLSAFVLLILAWLPGIRPTEGHSPAKLPARGFILIGLLLIPTVVQGGIALLIPGLLPLDPTNNGLSKALFERVQGQE